MISAEEILRLPYSADLSAAGAAYAMQTLPAMRLPNHASPAGALHRMAAAAAAELALRRYLTAKGITFGIHRGQAFGRTDQYAVVLKGRRCELRTYLLSNARQVLQLQEDPKAALAATALVPLDQHAAEYQDRNSTYVFAVAAGRSAVTSRQIAARIRAGEQTMLIHTMPRSWCMPAAEIPLGKLRVRSTGSRLVSVTLYGQGMQGEPLACSVTVPEGEEVEFRDAYRSLAFVRANTPITESFSIWATGRREPHHVGGDAWVDLWVDGKAICVMGWISREEFSLRAQMVLPGMRVWQFGRTRATNLGMPMAALKPVRDLLEGDAIG